ncbi:MAG: hypothetical protein HYW33_00405 [Candidatus Blackburnbacteria bacterium]|nr:hypothetical protein [Candidatus Blackburnbacteria bacterium]
MTNSKHQAPRYKFLKLLVCFLIFVYWIFASSIAAYAQEDATASSVRDLVREKVKETIQTLAKDPRAVMGALAQPSYNGFEIKTRDNKTSLVSTNIDTKYYQITKGVKKEVKAEDLAVGAFVVALGYQNQDVLEAKRVIGYDQSPLNFKKQIYFGKVTNLSKNTITIQNQKSDEEKTFKVTSKTEITTFSQDKEAELDSNDIEAGNRVVVVITIDEKNNTQVLRVHVVKDVQAAMTPTAVPTKPEATATPTKKPTPTTAQ